MRAYVHGGPVTYHNSTLTGFIKQKKPFEKRNAKSTPKTDSNAKRNAKSKHQNKKERKKQTVKQNRNAKSKQ